MAASILGQGRFLRGYAVVAMVDALLTYIKESNNMLLLNKLSGLGVFSADKADAFVEAIAKLGRNI